TDGGAASDDGESFAAAQTPPLEHRAAGGGQHTFEEAVLPSARDAFRLVGTLGHRAWILESGLQPPGECDCRDQLPRTRQSTASELRPQYISGPACASKFGDRA